ncbi:uncharacterized protein LOC118075194 isoform X3 [Zootoca vivipara]|uniref:uncharacterized protein LOC118075194 isoform X3 n=1 Tax=Zootoca vivipara TaxID=8524 RepID=UPI00293BCDD7|nr:uncharacterized protein LOC118075194 isoform X3 [Zootoca vivipara]
MERGFPVFWGRQQYGRGFYAANFQNANYWSGWWNWQQNNNHCPNTPSAWVHCGKPHNYNVPYQGSGWNHSQGSSNGAHSSQGHHRGAKSKSSKGKGRSKKPSHSSGLINKTPNKKGNNFEKTGGPSATPESKQGQENSASLVKKTDTPKVDLKSSKTIMSPKDFSFHLPSVSSTCPQSKQEVPSKGKKEIEVKLEDSRTSEDPPSQTAPLSPVHAPSKTAEGLPATVKEEPVVVELKDRQAAEQPPSQALSFPSAEASIEDQPQLVTTEGIHTTKKELPVLLEAIPPKDHFSHVGSPPAVEIPFLSETTNENHSEGKEDIELLEAIPPKDHFSHVGSPPAVEIPFLSETSNENHSEGKEDIELTQITSSLKDGDLHKSCAVLATSSSSLPSTLSDVRVVPVLVREKKYEKLEAIPPKDHFSHVGSPPAVEIPFLSETTNENHSEGKEDIELTQITSSLKDEDLHKSCAVLASSSSSLLSTLSDVRVVPVLVRAKKYERAENVWAPEDCQAPPCNVNEVGKCHRVSEHDSDLVLSQSPPHSLISCDQKSDTERWLEYCSCSPKNQHSSDSRHSSTNWTTGELHIQRSRSPHRREQSHGSSDRSPRSRKGRHSSDSHHSRASRASRELHLQRSRSPHMRERSHGSSDLSPWRREHSSFCHCGYCYNPHRKNFYERDSPPSYLVQKRSHRYSPERSELYKAPHSYNRESPREKLKKKISSSQKTEKKKKATAISEKAGKSIKTKKKTKGDQASGAPISSETAQKLQPVETELSDPIQATTCSEDADPTHPLCAGEKDGFSSSSRASEDRSAAVLARKEEIEQAYQRVLLNFAVVTAMLLETKPCMEAAMEAALRANLRRIGNYYECMLEDFIDSYDLANAI